MEAIILIGGAPTAGKSYAAEALSKRFGIPWISTDMIRDIMVTTADRAKYPSLFDNEHVMPEHYLTTLSAEEIVQHQNLESDSVWEGVRAFVEKNYNWPSFIVEGVAVLPHLVQRDLSADPRVLPYFMSSKDENQIREVVYKRGLWADAKSYSDELKPKEIAWVQEFNKWLAKEVKQHSYPSFTTGDIDGMGKDIRSKLL